MRSEELLIYYPSGNIFQVFGRFVKHGKLRREENSRYGVAVENLESVVIGDARVSPGSISLLDPRCVIVGKESGVLYTPRPHMGEFPAEMRQWMHVNPDWPARLELEWQNSA
ncbi:MAG: hypothetical protein K8R36_03635 [Planctomycetales bacterium]|nr:hypothetical protein [Planctomycetales bacterium]